MSMDISPLAPKNIVTLAPIKGVRIATKEAGIKYKGRKDLLFMVFDQPAQAAGVFTQSKCASAPVDHCRMILSKGTARGLVVNAGNANAFTGKKGKQATDLTVEMAAQALECQTDDIYLASTGVIGEPLDASQFSGLLEQMAEEAISDNWLDAAKTIMTTDTYPKLATAKLDMDGVDITINGIAKGSGMIAPDMATTLAFVVTDAPIAAPILQDLLSMTVRSSFNAITVDSDTSTSDTLLLFATGTADAPMITSLDDPRLKDFTQALDKVILDLALQVVRDGEGASKLIEVQVEGATSALSAKKIAMAIANSPLVKTAIAGEDANWGRVVMAVGKAGEPADRDRLAIWFGDSCLAREGERVDDYDEARVSNYMKNKEIIIRVELGLGNGTARVWGCDLTKKYVEINGDYRS